MRDEVGDGDERQPVRGRITIERVAAHRRGPRRPGSRRRRPPASRPASRQRSTAASVCPTRCSTPPPRARSGWMCPGVRMSAGPFVGSATTRIDVARSDALIPVVTPYCGAGIDADRERGSHRIGVLARLEREPEAGHASRLERDADHPLGAEHEVDHVGGHQLRGANRGRPRFRGTRRRRRRRTSRS